MGWYKHFQMGDEEIDPADVARLEEINEAIKEKRKNWTASDYHAHYSASRKITKQDFINDAMDIAAMATAFANNMQQMTNEATMEILTNKQPEVKK